MLSITPTHSIKIFSISLQEFFMPIEINTNLFVLKLYILQIYL